MCALTGLKDLLCHWFLNSLVVRNLGGSLPSCRHVSGGLKLLTHTDIFASLFLLSSTTSRLRWWPSQFARGYAWAVGLFTSAGKRRGRGWVQVRPLRGRSAG